MLYEIALSYGFNYEDESEKIYILNLINDDVQTFITTTEIDKINEDVLNKVFEIFKETYLPTVIGCIALLLILIFLFVLLIN